MNNTTNAVDVQKIAGELVNSYVWANVGAMVEYILRKSIDGDRDAPFSYDDLNLYPDPSDWDIEQLHTYITQELGDTWEDATGESWERSIEEENEVEVENVDGDGDPFWEWATEITVKIVTPLDSDGLSDYEIEDETDKAREYIRDNASPAEVYEWWMVDPWLAARLEEEGEIILDDNIWGRQATGQAIKLDHVIQKIALGR